MLFGTSYGMQGTFGVFFKPLSGELDLSRTVASAAPALSQIVMNVTALFWGLGADRWGARAIIGASGMLVGLGWLLSSTVHSTWQLYLFFGVIFGAGLGGIAPALVGITSRWFDRKRGLALGMGFSGLGAGLFLFSPLARWLIDTLGWRETMGVFAFISWGVIAFGVLLLRQPPQHSDPVPEHLPEPSGATAGHEVSGSPSAWAAQGKVTRASEPTAWQAVMSFPFLTFSVMWFMATLVLFLILIHLVPRATDAGVPPTTAVFTLGLVGLFSIVGKLGGGLWGDRIGPQRAFFVMMLVQAGALFWLLIASSTWMFFLFAIVFGISYGGWVPQVPNLMAKIFGLRHMATLYGALWMTGGMGGAVGPVLGGYIFDVTESYFVAFALAGTLAVVAATLSLLLRTRYQHRQRA